MTISSIDKKAREKSIEILRSKFGELAKSIIEGKKPVLILPKRVLTNTIYDIKRKLLLLGPEMQRRSLLDMNEARKFMQTLLMASIIYDALVNDEYPTIRDLYYRGKHTITYRDPKGRLHHENTWDEQRESDSVIRDIEVYLGLLREEMLILSKEKGKVVGNLVIKSGDDIIDLSKMGHGAYAIEPTPDLIEFKDVDAEFVLVVEKDAVFQQLHRYGFWKKYKAILITSAGQPDRATRRFVRRLNDELKLPIYILTDADPYGWYIYSVFKIGSITLSYESERLATPSVKFLGVSMTDVFGEERVKKYAKKLREVLGDEVKKLVSKKPKKPYLTEKERKNYIIKAKPKDVERAIELVGYDIAAKLVTNPEIRSKIRGKEGIAGYPWFRTLDWIREISIFFDTLSKLEIEAMASKGLRFLADNYIPTKIETGDWID